jgi:hypothetical protein
MLSSMLIDVYYKDTAINQSAENILSVNSI